MRQVRALVSCIQPGLVICFTLDTIHVSMLFSWNIPLLNFINQSCYCFGASYFNILDSVLWEVFLDPWVGKVPQRRKWQPNPVLWPDNSHGQRTPWDCRVGHDLVTEQQLHTLGATLFCNHNLHNYPQFSFLHVCYLLQGTINILPCKKKYWKQKGMKRVCLFMYHSLSMCVSAMCKALC